MVNFSNLLAATTNSASSYDSTINIMLNIWNIGFPIMMALLGGVLASAIFCLFSRQDFKAWAFGRSQCDSCKEVLKWYELIPALSYLLQKGCCRHCKAPIPYTFFIADLCGISLGWAGGNVALTLHASGMPVWGLVAFAACLFFLLISAMSDLYDTMISTGIILLMFISSFVVSAAKGNIMYSGVLAVFCFAAYFVVYGIQQITGKGVKSGGFPEVAGFGSADLFLLVSLCNIFSPLHTGLICMSAVLMFSLLNSTVRKLTYAEGPTHFPLFPFCCVGMFLPLAFNPYLSQFSAILGWG